MDSTATASSSSSLFGGAQSNATMSSSLSASDPARARSPPYSKEQGYQPSGSMGSSTPSSRTSTLANAALHNRSSGVGGAPTIASTYTYPATAVGGSAGGSVPMVAGGASTTTSDGKEASQEGRGHRKRSSSVLQVEKIEQSHEELLDQSAGFNYNADWVNYKGAWVMHVVLIVLGKMLLDALPSMGQDLSWTIVNLGYMALTYLMFHYVTGVPFESNSGAYDELTLWEQIDEGAQYTPAKKWLTSVPIGLFLISTHYTRYNPFLFTLNFCATLFVLFPKLPILHRLRFKIMMPFTTPAPSMPVTPTPSRPSSAASFR